jgi:hypothetical protein
MAVAWVVLGISLLLWIRGALKRDRSNLIASAVVLLIALIIPGLVNRSSAVCGQVGFELIVFGVVALL